MMIFGGFGKISASIEKIPKKLNSTTKILQERKISKNKLHQQQQQQLQQLQEKQEHKIAQENYDKKWEKSFIAKNNQKWMFSKANQTDLTILPIAYNTKLKLCTQLGRSDSYKRLVNDKPTTKYIKSKFVGYKEICTTHQDHINAECIHSLIGFDRNKARAITTSSELNRSKEYAKKGQE